VGVLRRRGGRRRGGGGGERNGVEGVGRRRGGEVPRGRRRGGREAQRGGAKDKMSNSGRGVCATGGRRGVCLWHSSLGFAHAQIPVDGKKMYEGGFEP